MCSGSFKYEEMHQYKVRFALMDVYGNTNKTWAEWTDFDSPWDTQ